MSNVLPGAVQKENWRLHRAHFIMALAYALILVAAIAALALMPSYLTLHAGSAENSSPDAAKNADRTTLVAAQSLVSLFSPILSATTTPSVAIAAALSDKPKSAIVEHITYTNGSPSQIILVGSASGRVAINAYRQALTSDPHFSSVMVPVGDLLGTEGGNFSITLTGKF